MDLDPDPDPDPHSDKLLDLDLDPDPDPHKMNADPQPCGTEPCSKVKINFFPQIKPKLLQN